MKTIITTTLLCFIAHFLNGQLDQSQSSILSTGNTVLLPADYLRNNLVGNNNLPTNTVGSQYLNEEFSPSLVTINDTTTYNAMLRYNAYSDEIEMKNDDKITALFKRPYISAKIGDSTYEILDYTTADNQNKTGYFVVIRTNGSHKFYRKDYKIFKPGKQAASTYKKDTAPTFEDRRDYYVLLENNANLRGLKLKKKSITELLGKESELNSFIKKNKLDLKNESDLVKLFRYYNTL